MMSARKQGLFVWMSALLVFGMVFGAVTPVQAAGGVAASLSASQEAFSADQAVSLELTLTNTGARAVKVLKWYTPSEGEIEEALFSVTLDGQPVAYLGAVYKRPAPTSADYITLKPGAAFTRTLDLAAYYDLSASGSYTVAYTAASPNLYTEKTSAKAKRVDTLTSNEVTVWVEGRTSGPAVDEVTPLAVTGATTFNKCTASQQTTALSARAQASTYSAGALGYLNADKTGLRYTTWFGAVTASRYATVTNHFSAISGAMDTASVKIDCGCKKNYYAYVYPTRPYTIYVCKAFWTAPLTGTDSKAGTLIHEMSHFNVVASTDDYVYGQAGAKALAISNPNNAVNNADNHEYFAENTPALP